MYTYSFALFKSSWFGNFLTNNYLYTNKDIGQTIAIEPMSQQLFTDRTHLKI